MKLSEDLKQDNECGDFGKALEGYAERAEVLEDIIQKCFDDICRPSGKVSKGTALLLMEHANRSA